MSVLVVGVSHSSAPIDVLEQVALGDEGPQKLISAALGCDHVTEVAVVATCNRVEIYAEVDRFHGSVERLSRLLLDRVDADDEAVLPCLYVHYDDGAVAHLFHVAAGLESMAVGEGQILGQTREALRVGQETGSVGPSLNVLFQQALRVGKRARAETAVDQVAPTLVDAALAQACGSAEGVRDQRVLVIGAGAMAGLSVATVSRLGATEIVVANRTAARAQRLVSEFGVKQVGLADLQPVLRESDLVIACTGASGVLITADMLTDTASRPIRVIDLALPHDVDRAAGDLAHVTLVGLAELADTLEDSPVAGEIEQVRNIVADEVTAFLAARRQSSVTPTVVALRSMATSVVEAEMNRLAARLPDLDDVVRTEIAHSVRRVADKLLHEPTVRVKELVNDDGAVSYATALAELFSLDPDAVDAVTRPEGLS